MARYRDSFTFFFYLLIILHFSILLHCCIIRSLISVSDATQNCSQSLLYFKMSLNSPSIATCFGLTRPSSGNCSPTEGTHGRLVRTTHEGGTTWTPQNENNAERGESVHSHTNDDVQQHGMHWHTNWCSAAVSIGEQLSEDGLVRPKHVAIECDFYDILK
jgi:hypothetical protein